MRTATVVWLPEPGDDPPLPPGATLLRGSADLPGAHLIDLVATMDRLRVECPWDARQTHQSLAPHLLEEPYEALEALESGDEQAFCEELGDVLLQVVFHARVAAERAGRLHHRRRRRRDRGQAGPAASARVRGRDGLRRGRGPPQLGRDQAGREEGTGRTGRSACRCRRRPPSALDGVPFGQPALALAAQLQRRAARAGVPDELARLDGDPGVRTGPGGEIGRELFRLVAEGPGGGARSRDGTARRRAPLPRSRARLGAVLIRRILF